MDTSPVKVELTSVVAPVVSVNATMPSSLVLASQSSSNPLQISVIEGFTSGLVSSQSVLFSTYPDGTVQASTEASGLPKVSPSVSS